MATISIRGKSLKAVAYDIAEGYITVNPLYLKTVDAEALSALYHEIARTQVLIRGERFSMDDKDAIRWRNVRLQRLNAAGMIIKNFARERRIIIV